MFEKKVRDKLRELNMKSNKTSFNFSVNKIIAKRIEVIAEANYTNRGNIYELAVLEFLMKNDDFFILGDNDAKNN